jgi:hypothetical protein
MTTHPEPSALTLQMLAWIAQTPRTYRETMEAWRTSCPRLAIWEDAQHDQLMVVRAGGAMGPAVRLTERGQALLDNSPYAAKGAP